MGSVRLILQLHQIVDQNVAFLSSLSTYCRYHPPPTTLSSLCHGCCCALRTLAALKLHAPPPHTRNQNQSNPHRARYFWTASIPSSRTPSSRASRRGRGSLASSRFRTSTTPCTPWRYIRTYVLLVRVVREVPVPVCVWRSDTSPPSQGIALYILQHDEETF